MPLAVLANGMTLDYTHGCEVDEGIANGLLGLHQSATSSCCEAILQEGGNPDIGFKCTECGKDCERVLSDHTAHWTCLCGETRSQVINKAADTATDVEGDN